MSAHNGAPPLVISVRHVHLDARSSLCLALFDEAGRASVALVYELDGAPGTELVRLPPRSLREVAAALNAFADRLAGRKR